MKEVNKGLILTSAILEINRDKIKIEEIYNYQKHISEKLRNIGYTFENIDFLDVVYFCEAYDFHCTKDKVIIINAEDKKKLKLDAYKDLPQELIGALKFDKKYILPLNQDKKITLYYVNFMNKDLIESLQTEGLLKYNSNGEYIINLNSISIKLDVDKLKILRKLFVGSTLDIKDCYRSENVIRIMNALDFITEENFRYFYEGFSNSHLSIDNFSKEYNELYEIYSISKMNAAWMEKIGLNIPINSNKKGNQKTLTRFNT
ncbi:MAG: hypothetical protein IJY25_06200 [Bacilli bacterium]|nr:hypothetical protein [Bacilli bacterium]